MSMDHSADADPSFAFLQWFAAVEAAEEEGKPDQLIAMLRSEAEMTTQVRLLLADLFDRRHFSPRPRVSENETALWVAADEFRERYPLSRLRRRQKERGQAYSLVRDEAIEAVAREFEVTVSALRHTLDGRSRAGKKRQKLKA